MLAKGFHLLGFAGTNAAGFIIVRSAESEAQTLCQELKEERQVIVELMARAKGESTCCGERGPCTPTLHISAINAQCPMPATAC